MMFLNVTFDPFLLDREITSCAEAIFARFFHGGTTTSSVSNNRFESRRTGRGLESKPERATIIGTGVAIFPPICVRWWKAWTSSEIGAMDR